MEAIEIALQSLMESIQSPWGLKAIYVSILVGISCGILGCFVVLRNMALIGDALSHAMLPGPVFGLMIAGSISVVAFFVGALAAGIFTALVITFFQENFKVKNDAAVGIVFTAMFAIGVIAITHLSRSDGFHIHTDDFLFGNVLQVSEAEVILSSITSLLVIVGIVLFYRSLFVSTFQPELAQTMGVSPKVIHYLLMLLLSFAIIASIKTVGVILVVAMLITPASTALLLSHRLKAVLVLAAFFGVLAAVLGFCCADLFDWPPGPSMTVLATLIYLVVALFAPSTGFLSKIIHRNKERSRIHLEDTLKQAFKLHEKNQLSFRALQERVGLSDNTLKKMISRLTKLNLLEKSSMSITPLGVKAANKLVRAHRLWETYLVNELGVSEEHIHQDAEDFEHILDEEMLDDLAKELNFPDTDPHGSPIPKK